MSEPPPLDPTVLGELAARHGVPEEAVAVLWNALVRGQGRMAQFDHPALGGMGQWMAGGMTMIGQMGNLTLKATVDRLCADLAALMASSGPSSPSAVSWPSASAAAWWPAELGTPTASGAQNDSRYAYFAGARRLVVEHHGARTVYDTLDHQITGVSQQQGADATLSFTSQKGVVRLADLPTVRL
jgi:hypothetical protein